MARQPDAFPEVFLSSPPIASRVSRALGDGRVRKLAPALYTTNVSERPEAVVRRLLWQIVSLLFPGAVITDRTAFESGPAKDGSVFLAADVDRDVALPGITLRARKALSHNGVTRTLIRSLDFLQRYTLAIDFSTLEGAEEQLLQTNAFRDAHQADAEGVRLVLP